MAYNDDLRKEVKDLILKNKQYIQNNNWDGFFESIEAAMEASEFTHLTEYTKHEIDYWGVVHEVYAGVFQFCLECVPDLLYKITYIPRYAFFGSDIKSINIPSNIKEIRECAFVSSLLERIDIPNSVKRIGYGAFSYCESLEYVIIPDGVMEISEGIFEGDYNLKYLSISKRLEGKSFLYDIDECEDCEIEVRE